MAHVTGQARDRAHSAAACACLLAKRAPAKRQTREEDFRGRRWLPATHAAVWLLQAVYQMAEDAGDRVAQGRSLWQLGSALSDQGHFKDAEVPLREALTVLEGELGGDHLDIAKACNGAPLSLTEGHAVLWSAAARPSLLPEYTVMIVSWTIRFGLSAKASNSSLSIVCAMLAMLDVEYCLAWRQCCSSCHGACCAHEVPACCSSAPAWPLHAQLWWWPPAHTHTIALPLQAWQWCCSS